MKGTMAVMHELALLKAENRTLREANTSLAKRRRIKKSRLRQGGTLSIGEGQDLLDQKDVDIQLGDETRASSSRANSAVSSAEIPVIMHTLVR